MKVLMWLHAMLVVYMRRLAAMSGKTRAQVIMVLAALLVSAWIGMVATIILLLAGGLVLPLLNPDVKAEIDAECDKEKY